MAAAAVVVGGLAFGQSRATATCYYAGGGCGYNSLSANTWTPWTGFYSSSRSWIQPNDNVVLSDAWLQIKNESTGDVGGWQAGGAVILLWAKSYGSRSAGHRCQHSGPFSKSVRCGFNANP